MPQFWLDANSLIQAKNGPFKFERIKSFWVWLDGKIREGYVVMPKQIYKEIVEQVQSKDQLAQWVKNRREKGLCIKPNRDVQNLVQQVADYVNSRHDWANSWEFLDGADAWLIAHALYTNGTVVTHESSIKPNAKKARIPNVCKHFGVKCVDLYQLLDILNADI